MKTSIILSAIAAFCLSITPVCFSMMKGEGSEGSADIERMENGSGAAPLKLTMNTGPAHLDPMAQQNAEKEARALVNTFASFSGTCPEISCGGTLCALICCPCCICCIAEGLLKECCSLPKTRVSRKKQAVRDALEKWKVSLTGLDSNHPSVVNYNAYLATIKGNHAEDKNEVHIFNDDADFTTFLIPLN